MVLIILATISINSVFGENGIIKRAEAAKRLHEQKVQEEAEGLNQLLGEYENMINGDSIPDVPVEPQTPKGPNGKPLVNKDTVNKIEHDKIIGEDRLGNQVVIPNGFKVAEESGDNVEDGIVIEDSDGNQFVWVPVSNIDGDGVVNNQSANGLITRKNGEKVQITLGRYTFATASPGTPTLVQKGSEYANENINNIYTINSYNTELTISRESNYNSSKTGQNATALNLGTFIESTKNNYGYYIGRYEASFGSGESIDNCKPLSQKSEQYSTSSINIDECKPKTLWSFLKQGDASKVSRNMYAGNSYVESDLTNSYMWDTAIVYIQAMGNTNYANATRGANDTLTNTGETGDEKCHIFDMAGNNSEWTTEYSAYVYGSSAAPCISRGGHYNGVSNYVAGRASGYANSYNGCAFRVCFYVK